MRLTNPTNPEILLRTISIVISLVYQYVEYHSEISKIQYVIIANTLGTLDRTYSEKVCKTLHNGRPSTPVLVVL